MDNESIWKKLIDLGIFDDFYPQRLNACFRYLDVEKAQSFSLKDLMQKGFFVFSYLSLDIEHESTFAIMDIFRTFDRSGSGAVTIEEFVIGMVEKLFALYKNTVLLEYIANEVLAIENRASELAARLEKEAISSDKLVQFRSHLKALLYLIRDKLRYPPKAVGYAVNLTAEMLTSLFQECILQAIHDSISYFHISNERISGIFMEFEGLLTKSHSGNSADHSGTLSLQHYSDSVWNLSGPRLMSGGCLLGSAAAAAAVGLVPSYEQAQCSASVAGGPGQVQGAAGTPHGTPSTPANGVRAGSPTFASDGEEDGFTHKGAHGVASAAGASARGGRKRSILALNDPQAVYESLQQPTANLVSLGLEPEALDALSGLAASNGNIDSSQLYLLQAAFRSLESFFSLADTVPPAGQDPSGTPPAARSTKLSLSAPADAQTVAFAVAKSSDLKKNADYVGAEGGAGVNEQAAPILATGFEYDLAQQLMETQEALRKTRMRMDVLEMVQEEAMMGENSVYIEDDDELLNDGLGSGPLSRAISLANTETSQSEETRERGGEFSMSRAASEEEIVQQVEQKYGNKVTSFDGIMSELAALRACLSERATDDYPLGHLLDHNVAILSLEDAPTSGANPETEAPPKPVPAIVKNMTDTIRDVVEIVKVKTQASSASQTVVATLKQQDEKLIEFKTNAEQAEIARNEFTSLTVELQILREKIQRHAKNEGQLSMLQAKNQELSRHVKELEEQLGGDGKSRRGKDSSESKSENKKMHELRTLNQQLEMHKSAQAAESERLQKENQRLKAAMTISEQRVKGALQDQMTLHHQLQQLEEDNMSAKATITKLTREMEDHKISRGHREDADRRISELQREIHKRDVELAEAREDASQALKYQSELSAAEKTIEHLEMSVGEMSVEMEKGSVAMLQLDSYREQLRLKTKENRDMSLHIHGLENQLKDVPYLQTRYAEVQEELEDCKMKIEKLPGLLSEQARLRGSSRASVKALQEHDKTLSHYKNRVKQLERETAVLKNDNRAMQELELKLKESNAEVKRLLTLIAEGGNPNKPPGPATPTNAGLSGLRLPNAAEEEKKKAANGNDGQYRKMRSRIRQSIAASGSTGTAGMAAAVAASLNHT